MPLRFKIAGSILFAVLFVATVGSVFAARANRPHIIIVDANAPAHQEK